MSDIERRAVGVIVEWQAVDHAWTDHRWRVTAVLPSAADVAPFTLLSEEPGVRRYYAGEAELLLYPRETDTLKYNVEGATPAVYVFLRACAEPPGIGLLGATVCVGEAHAHADTGADLVEAVPMPAEILAWTTDFVARHHVERVVYKRRREGVTPREAGKAAP
jgi:hypothetical protein